jgi:hypothetical protein
LTPRLDLAVFAAKIDSTLADRTSWIARGNLAVQRVDSGPVDSRSA